MPSRADTLFPVFVTQMSPATPDKENSFAKMAIAYKAQVERLANAENESLYFRQALVSEMAKISIIKKDYAKNRIFYNRHSAEAL